MKILIRHPEVDLKKQEDIREILQYDDFYVFETAYSPPVAWLEKVCEMFPKLEFTLNYEEGGNGFQGEAYGVDGELSDNCWDWDGNWDEDGN